MSTAAISLSELTVITSLPIPELFAKLAQIVDRGRRSFGVDWSPEARDILRVRAPQLAAHLEGRKDNIDDELDRLYAEVREATAGGNEPRRRALFETIEALEAAEAERMSRYFQEHAPFDPQEARAAIQRARALLQKNANSSSGHTSS